MSWEEESFCYVTTTGRVTGQPHTIEIWFAASSDTIYLLSGGGGRSDWARNIQRDPAVEVRIGDHRFRGTGRKVIDPDEEELARTLVYDKYSAGYGGDLSGWRRRSLPVAIDLDVGRGGPA